MPDITLDNLFLFWLFLNTNSFIFSLDLRLILYILNSMLLIHFINKKTRDIDTRDLFE